MGSDQLTRRLIARDNEGSNYRFEPPAVQVTGLYGIRIFFYRVGVTRAR